MFNPQSAFPMSKLLPVGLVSAACLVGCAGFSAASSTPAASLTPSPTLPLTETPSPTATPSPSPTVTPQIFTPEGMPASWHILFADFFDTSDSWFVGSSEQEDQPYIVSIRDGKYVWSFMPGTEPGITGTVPATIPNTAGDFFVTVEVQQTEGEKACSYGFMLRSSTEGGYYFDIGDREGTFGFNFVSQDEWLFYDPSGRLREWWLSYKPPQSSAVRPFAPNTLGVIAEGSSFSLFINDELVGQVTDDHVNSGMFGLSLSCDGEAEVAFDNFAVFVP